MSDAVLQWQSEAQRAERLTGVSAADLLGLIDVESGGIEGRTSGAGAGGLTQFMPGTAKGYGVDVRPGHARSQIMGAARYLVALGYKTDKRKALASYNGGPGNPQFGYAMTVLARAAKYRGAKPAGGHPATPAPVTATATNASPVDQGGGEWGGGLLAPVFKLTATAFVYIALIGGGALLVGLGTHRALNRQAAA